MNTNSTGELVRTLREEQGFTQKQLAEQLCISDKTVSKWECDAGLPDVALLPVLAKTLGTSVNTLLTGNLIADKRTGGTMKRLAFRVCSSCGNIITTTGDAEVSCCGRTLAALEVQTADEAHRATITDVEGDYYVTFEHPMTKDHHFAFAAVVGYDRMAIEKLYPEQDAEVRLPRLSGGKLYTYCTTHGLMRH